MQQTADVEILWITVDVAAECLPAYGSFFSSAAVADGDAMATDVDVEMTAACGSSFFSAAVVDSVTDSVTDAVMDADVETAVATADAAASYETQILFVQTDQRRGKLYPRLFMFCFCASPVAFRVPLPAPFPFSFANILHPLHRSHSHQ